MATFGITMVKDEADIVATTVTNMLAQVDHVIVADNGSNWFFSGAPDDRWGEQVSAIVQAAPGTEPTADELIAHCRAHLAGYKVPKTVDFVDAVVRSPAGKPDYRWARDLVT
mgnify:CR=1 FL=1